MVLYYVKVINVQTGSVVGYYKDKGVNCLSKIKKGIKFWDNKQEALDVSMMLDNSFVRDEDKHYYTAHAVVIGEPGHKPKNKPIYEIQSEEDRKYEVDAFIRQNHSRIE